MQDQRIAPRFSRIGLAIAIAALGSVAVTAAAPGTAQAACSSRLVSDFNGDGFADAVAPEPLADEGGQLAMGAVRILYGKSSGISSTGNQRITEASLGSIITPEKTDEFGVGPVSGFFNNDCYADLAIGIPVRHDDIGNQIGGVVVIYGSSTGLKVSTAKLFTLAEVDPPAVNIDFGDALADGDFNGDGLTDLAIGAEGASTGGAVGVLYGSSSGLTLAGKQWFTQDSTGVPGTGEYADGFGASLAAGDFNGDGRADLAVGVPEESLGTADDFTDAGDVVILPGSKSGLTGNGSKAISQNTAGMPGPAMPNNEFGTSLAAGDVTGDGKVDLLVGSPMQNVGTADYAGAVTLVKGGSAGLSGTGAQVWTQDSPGVQGTAEQSDSFGLQIAVGDFNGDGRCDVAIASGEGVGTASDAGSVTILRGASTGLTGTGSQVWTQNTAGISGTAEKNDGFGGYLQIANVVSHKYAGLVIGVPGEDTGTLTDNGAIEVMRGGSNGLTATGSQFFDGQGLVGGAENNEQMGLQLAL